MSTITIANVSDIRKIKPCKAYIDKLLKIN